MKAKFIFLTIIIAALSMGKANSQIMPPVTKATLSGNDKTILNQQLSEYVAFKIDKRELIDSLYTNGACQFQIRINEQLNWTIDLEFNDMRAPDFKQTYTTDEGEFEWKEPFVVNTFKGKTSDGQIVRFTIDENTFSGIVLYDQHHYEIRPVKNYTRNSTDENLIVFRSSDLISNDDDFDYINDAIKVAKDDESEMIPDIIRSSASSYAVCTWFLRIATDADFQFYQKMGNSVTNTYNRIFSVLNEVEGVYESTFNMRFIITFQNVFTTNTAYTSTNSNTLLTQFQTYWNLNRSAVSRNLAHLFTGKNLDENVVGKAYVGKIRNPNKNPNPLIPDICLAYALSMERTRMYQTTAHEIGHNLDANHPSASDCNCNLFSPDPPYESIASVMCQRSKRPNLWFCGQSTGEILYFIHKKKSYLTRNLSTSLNLSGTVSGFQSYETTETITSTQVINSGFTSYKAGNSITLNPGFHAKAGSVFTATIEENDSCKSYAPIQVTTWYDAMCRGNPLRFNVTNATSYSIEIRELDYSWVHRSTGSVTGNSVVVWNAPSSLPESYFAMYIGFFSPVYAVSRKYILLVYPCRDNALAMFEMEEKIITQEIQSDSQFDFDIYPNPNDGNFSLTIDTQKMQPFFVEIFNSSGELVSKTEYYNVYQINLNNTNLPQGIYLVKVTMGNNVSTKKIVVQ